MKINSVRIVPCQDGVKKILEITPAGRTRGTSAKTAAGCSRRKTW